MIDVGTTSAMTLAVLSFETRKSPACLRFLPRRPRVDESRDPEPNHAQGTEPAGRRRRRRRRIPGLAVAHMIAVAEPKTTAGPTANPLRPRIPHSLRRGRR